MAELSASDQLLVAAKRLLRQTSPDFSATKDEIAETGTELALMVLVYFDDDQTP